jgi:hypothetical protein
VIGVTVLVLGALVLLQSLLSRLVDRQDDRACSPA